MTTWLYRKPKYWLTKTSIRLSIEELETLVAQRAKSVDPVRASVGQLQEAVMSLALTLNSIDPGSVRNAAVELASKSPVDAETIADIDTRLQNGESGD